MYAKGWWSSGEHKVQHKCQTMKFHANQRVWTNELPQRANERIRKQKHMQPICVWTSHIWMAVGGCDEIVSVPKVNQSIWMGGTGKQLWFAIATKSNKWYRPMWHDGMHTGFQSVQNTCIQFSVSSAHCTWPKAFCFVRVCWLCARTCSHRTYPVHTYCISMPRPGGNQTRRKRKKLKRKTFIRPTNNAQIHLSTCAMHAVWRATMCVIFSLFLLLLRIRHAWAIDSSSSLSLSWSFVSFVVSLVAARPSPTEQHSNGIDDKCTEISNDQWPCAFARCHFVPHPRASARTHAHTLPRSRRAGRADNDQRNARKK